MIIYEQEKQDGLEGLISNNSVAFCTRLECNKAALITTDDFKKLASDNYHKCAKCNSEKICNVRSLQGNTQCEECGFVWTDPTYNSKASEIKKATGSEHINLYPVKSILVSSSINKNDDVFMSEDVFIARNSVKDQPCNIEHNEKQIIGHTTGSYVLDDQFNPIPDDIDIIILPKKIHILDTSVIYMFWQDKEFESQIAKMIEEIERGEWYVSMECLHANFDYMLVDGEEEVIVKRNQVTSFLTKYLRYYGGEGVYQGKKIYRVVRDFMFSGKGYVLHPANPESIIFNNVSANINNNVYSNNKNTSSILLENLDMTDLEKKIQELETKLTSALKERDEAQKQLAGVSVAKATELESKLTVANESISKLNKDIATKEETIVQLNKDKSVIAKELETVQKELKDLIIAKVKADRVSKLVAAGYEESMANGLVERMVDASDDVFEAFVLVAEAKKIGAPGNNTSEIKKSPMQSVKEYVKEEIAGRKSKSGEVQENTKQAKAAEEVLEELEKENLDDPTGSTQETNQLEEFRSAIATDLFSKGFRKNKTK